MNKPVVKIDVVSDVVCPWCYIGKRRLEKAIAELNQSYDVQLEYHPFELNPDMPAAGADQKSYLTKKFGSEDRYQQITRHVTHIASEEGLNFNFAIQNISPNTRLAHQLIHAAKQEGNHVALVESFFKAYFEEGVDLSNTDNLIAIATQHGLSRERAEDIIKTNEGAAEVAHTEREFQRLGVSGVPFYIINNKYGISGAQPAETFIQAITQINTSSVTAEGEACDVDSKNC